MSNQKGLGAMDTLSKICCRCNLTKPLDQFYKRKNLDSYVSECKDCMKERSKSHSIANVDYLVPRASSEILAIQYLHENGIPALPGKAIRHSHVDVVAFGCVEIEIKYSRMTHYGSRPYFKFLATSAQLKSGFRAQLVMLMCDYEDRITYHMFEASNPVFYMKERLKNTTTFSPGSFEAKKHGNNRLVMVQPMMDAAQDDLRLVYMKLKEHCTDIKKSA